MDYITAKTREKLTNKLYILSASELREMIRKNNRNIQETKHMTETSRRGETYYSSDGHPGSEKMKDNRMAFYKEVLYRD